MYVKPAIDRMCDSYIQEIDMVIKNLTQVASNWLPDSYAPDASNSNIYHGKLEYTVVGFSDNVIDAKLMRTKTLRYINLCCVMKFKNVVVRFGTCGRRVWEMIIGGKGKLFKNDLNRGRLYFELYWNIYHVLVKSVFT